MQLDIRGGIKVGILKQQDSGSGNIKINAGLLTLLFLSILFFFSKSNYFLCEVCIDNSHWFTFYLYSVNTILSSLSVQMF